MSAIADELGLARDRVCDALRNRVYLGEVRNSRGEWIPGRHPALIDPQTFLNAGAALSSRRHGSRPKEEGAETSAWWLREVARCALCGARMSAVYGGAQGARRYYFACAHRCSSRLVRVDAAQAACDPLVAERLAELHAELATVKPEKRIDMRALEERRGKLARRRARLLDAYADETMTKDELRTALAKLDEERTRIDAAAQGPKGPSREQRVSALKDVDSLRRAWRVADAKVKRKIVGSLARRVGLAHGQEPKPDWFSSEEIARAKEG